MTDTETMETVRQSFAARYDDCPQAARLSERYPGSATHAQARGTLLHQFAVRVVELCTERGERAYDPEQAKALMREIITTSGLPISAPEFDVLMTLAWKFADEHEFDIDNIVDLEEEHRSQVGGVTITGRPDVVEIRDRVATVRDYKTSFVIDPETDMDGSFQGRFYAKLIMDAYPHVHRVVLDWDYVRWGEHREAQIDRYQLPDLEAYLGTLVGRILRSREQDDWPAVAGSWCAICPAPAECPLLLAERRDGAPTDVKMAVEYGKQILATEAFLKQRKAQLRAWCDEGGPILVGDMEFGFVVTSDSERAINKAALRDAMEAVGLEWHAYFRTQKGSTQFKPKKVETPGGAD